jgi:hypothetical protein
MENLLSKPPVRKACAEKTSGVARGSRNHRFCVTALLDVSLCVSRDYYYLPFSFLPTTFKMDFKMMAMLPMMYFGRKIDFTKPEIVSMSQTALITVGALLLAIHYFVYTRINSKNNNTKIWVPPKPKPSLPFGMGPPEEPLKVMFS